jgi:hypothetical protein
MRSQLNVKFLELISELIKKDRIDTDSEYSRNSISFKLGRANVKDYSKAMQIFN